MRRLYTLLFICLVGFVSSVEAGVPSPSSGCFPNERPCPGRCRFGVSEPGAPCQYRFRADGGLDELTVFVTLRDAFELPVADCSTSVTLRATNLESTLCGCCPLELRTSSASDGTVQAVFGRLGGRGSLTVAVSAHCSGNIALFEEEYPFTSPDLDGSCDTAVSATGVLDLGIWANCLPPGPPCQASDFNCSASVDVLDLGTWAGGLGVFCTGGCP